MKKTLLILLLTSLLISVFIACDSNKPKNLLSDKKMVDMITDIHILEANLFAYQRQTRYNKDSLQKRTNIAYSNLFDKYGINGEVFEKNIKYYFTSPKKFGEILKGVHDGLRIADSLSTLTYKEPLQ